MRQLVEGDRVEIDVSRRWRDYGLVRGTISLVDDPGQGVDHCCYYIEFDEPIAIRQEGRYDFSSGRAEPIFHFERELCVNHGDNHKAPVPPHHQPFRLLSLLELIAEAAE